MTEEEYTRIYGMSRQEALKKANRELQTELRTKDKNRITAAYEKLRSILLADDALQANEVQANCMVTLALIAIVIMLLLTLLLNGMQVFDLGPNRVTGFFIGCILLCATGIAACYIRRGEAPWLKYLLIVISCVSMAILYALLGCRVALVMILPVILSIRYLSGRFTALISGLSLVLFLLATVLYAYIGTIHDLNCIPFESGWSMIFTASTEEAIPSYSVGKYLYNLLVWTFLPNLLQFIVIDLLAVTVARYLHITVQNQEKVTDKLSRIDTELSLATQIQADMMPSTFPAFANRPDFDLYASMHPAKEVGGDFYDFFLIDNNTLGMVIADVSGKGIPAALFMMRGKTLIKNEAMAGSSPAEVFRKVNQQLCENNKEDLFITAWFGRLDLCTGVITAANAGHEYPAVMHAGGQYELVKDRHGFVLGGMVNMKYKEYTMTLAPGDRLFLYTDGVPEAMNEKKEQFGTDRMLAVLNANRSADQRTVLEAIGDGLEGFVNDEPQFDDVTMLGLSYFGLKGEDTFETENEISVKPTADSTAAVLAFLEDRMEQAGVPFKQMNKINIAVDEIYSNVVKYSEAEWAKASVFISEKSVTVTLWDNGIPFDPLSQAIPDIHLDISEREVGGLGILLTRKLMSRVEYHYVNSYNKTTLMLEL